MLDRVGSQVCLWLSLLVHLLCVCLYCTVSSAYTSVHNLATHMCHLPHNCHLHSQWARLRHTKVACHIHVSFALALTETRRFGTLFLFYFTTSLVPSMIAVMCFVSEVWLTTFVVVHVQKGREVMGRIWAMNSCARVQDSGYERVRADVRLRCGPLRDCGSWRRRGSGTVGSAERGPCGSSSRVISGWSWASRRRTSWVSMVRSAAEVAMLTL